jgi:hypothetical protein
MYIFSYAPGSLTCFTLLTQTSIFHFTYLIKMNGREASLSALPVELADHITSFLSNHDIKSLRLTCSYLHSRVTLRLKRVFISANPLNIKVVEEVANHEQFRRGVTEIIWDEAYLGFAGRMLPPGCQEPHVYRDWNFNSHCPQWYQIWGKRNIDELGRSKGNDDLTNRPDHVARMRQLAAAMPPAESYAYYYEL